MHRRNCRSPESGWVRKFADRLLFDLPSSNLDLALTFAGTDWKLKIKGKNKTEERRLSEWRTS
ncbi:hypothetical protein COLO4_28760 [Corchorus olitorius]|uniref:Uncharacterized protein n=1 Tax=Corchorus olitorius TaxID=93759 RepID=A0A1R3HIJ2_9ROSI|nr:hypothetical protein COLO4_28760 [Corchorus olitorius]